MNPSVEFVANAVADNTSDPTLVLLTIAHTDLPAPERLVRNRVNITSRGEVFKAFPFELTLPSNSDGGSTPARLVIDNIDQRIVEIIRSISTPPTILIELVLGSDLDKVEFSLPPFKIYTAGADRNAIEVELNDSAEDQAESLVQWDQTPGLLPALFN